VGVDGLIQSELGGGIYRPDASGEESGGRRGQTAFEEGERRGWLGEYQVKVTIAVLRR